MAMIVMAVKKVVNLIDVVVELQIVVMILE